MVYGGCDDEPQRVSLLPSHILITITTTPHTSHKGGLIKHGERNNNHTTNRHQNQRYDTARTRRIHPTHGKPGRTMLPRTMNYDRTGYIRHLMQDHNIDVFEAVEIANNAEKKGAFKKI